LATLNSMPPTLSLTTTQELRYPQVAFLAFNELALRDGLVQMRHATFPAGRLTVAQLSVLGDVEIAERLPEGAAVLLRPEPKMLVHVSAVSGNGAVAVAGVDREAVDRVTNDLVASLRDAEPDDGHVPITFWAQSEGSPLSPRRRIPAPAWADIRDNYTPAAGEALDELMVATEPGPGGLLLWHGAPGAGKSYALRALAREWRPWCDTHFITDAEVFLGGQTGYLLDALMRSSSDPPGERRYRLIVLEDAGELLAADARAVAGQALSRLLNLSDGLLGAGMRTLVLVTTNEPLRRLHPAVVRPGRTWAEVEFGALSAQDANAWLSEHGHGDLNVEREMTLAELFALSAGRAVPAPVAVGFAA